MSSRSTTSLRKKELVELSKKLSKTLRHDAVEMNLNMGPDGRVKLKQLLRHPLFQQYVLADVMHVVEGHGNDKKRFESDGVHIRAVQGHSIPTIEDAELLAEVLDPSEIPVCVHGTTLAALPAILEQGLSRMRRNHIHMAAGTGDDVVSGMRESSAVVLHIDVAAAMAAGVRFYRSSNGVILTQGIDGVLPPEFIAQVAERRAAAAAASV